jgi:hypothetical protein
VRNKQTVRNVRLHILRVIFSILSLWIKSVLDERDQAAALLASNAKNPRASSTSRGDQLQPDARELVDLHAVPAIEALAEFLHKCLLPLGNVYTGAPTGEQLPVNSEPFDMNTFRNVLCDMHNPWLLHVAPGTHADPPEILSACESYLPKDLLGAFLERWHTQKTSIGASGEDAATLLRLSAGPDRNAQSYSSYSGSVSTATSFGFPFDTSSDPPAADQVYTNGPCIYLHIYIYIYIHATHHLIN